jgi:transcriptional regulator with XRE-family HTH domain
MAKDLDEMTVAAIATQRFNGLLDALLEQGHTQAQIAAEVGIPPQYLSDIKRGKRPMTELIARRLGEGFSFNHRWLMGTSDTMESPAQHSSAAADKAVWLPLFPYPIEGEPRQNLKWTGAGVEIAGVAAGKIGLARYPYVLQFGHGDVQRRLQQGDLILISQAMNPAAEIHVVRHRNKHFLARANQDGSWARVANDNQLPSHCPATGHCIGIVWSALI